MKKLLLILAVAIVFVIVLIYVSLWNTPNDARTHVLVNGKNIENIKFKDKDSISIAVSTLYEGDLLKNLVQGEHYRDEWATPVKVPVVFLDTLKGGLSIIKEGGGKQTKSLRLINPKGVVYTLRSLAKDPEPLIPEFAKTLGLENIIIDGISAQHPYAAMVVAKMAEAIHIQHTHPQLVFVPKQKQLKNYNSKYGNKLYWLEYETEGEQNWSQLKNIVAILDTEDLQEEKIKLGPNLNIDKEALVRNRLFDLVIGDWDRHAKQWGWMLQKNDAHFTAIPLAGDRDNAFFSTEGLIPTIISSKNIQPRLRSFEKDIDYIPGLVYPFDQYFLQNTARTVFINEAHYIQTHLTNTAIDEALALWPKEIYALHGKEIKERIISRRNDLESYAIRFYEALLEKGTLNEPLKGTDNDDIPQALHRCFECL